ncbi:MAG TPA: lytic transglycosylase domain-containing protein [Longimicrobiales bacterium]
MKRNPIVRALCERARRPEAIKILAGLLLMAPAGLMTMRSGELGVRSTPVPAVLAPIEVTAPSTPVAVASLAKRYKISNSLAEDIYAAAVEHDISPRTAFGLVRAESSFRTSATSPVGAIGLTQLMPATARWLSPGVTRSQLRNPETNLRIGFRYLRELKEKYKGNEKLALLAFNRGPGTVDKLLKRGRNPDNGYAEKVWTGKSAKHVSLMNKKFGKRS